MLLLCAVKPEKQNEAIDTETGTEEELEHDDDEKDEEEEDFVFFPLAALRKKPVTRKSKKTLSKQVTKSR